MRARCRAAAGSKCALALTYFLCSWLSSQCRAILAAVVQSVHPAQFLTLVVPSNFVSFAIMVKGKQVLLTTVLATFWLRKVEKLTFAEIGKTFQRGEAWARGQVNKVGCFVIVLWSGNCKVSVFRLRRIGSQRIGAKRELPTSTTMTCWSML